jgi:hypothetical protein
LIEFGNFTPSQQNSTLPANILFICTVLNIEVCEIAGMAEDYGAFLAQVRLDCTRIFGVGGGRDYCWGSKLGRRDVLNFFAQCSFEFLHLGA